MEEIKTFKSGCAKCGIKTPHFAIKQSRKRGILLKCCVCRAIKNRYVNQNKLVVWKNVNRTIERRIN